jgi:hypothetical protein
LSTDTWVVDVINHCLQCQSRSIHSMEGISYNKNKHGVQQYTHTVMYM